MPALTLLDNIPWMQRRTTLPSGLRVWPSRNDPWRCQRPGEAKALYLKELLLSLSQQVSRQDGGNGFKSALSASSILHSAAAR